MSMRIGFVVPSNDIGSDPDDIATWARRVEELGFSYLDVFDHVLGADTKDRPDWPGPYGIDHEFHEPFVLYGFLAAQTRLGLATGVLVLPQRQTALVAKQAAELDLLSRGRLRLGVGIGWNPVEHEALGLRFAARVQRYEEQIRVLRRLWTERVVTEMTEHHSIDRAGIAPLPIQRPIPIWLGGGAHPRVLERVGRLADGWMAHEPRAGARFESALAAVRESAERAGRDPATIGVQGRIDVHGQVDLDRFRHALDAWRDAGITHLSINATGQGRGLGPQLEVLHEVADVLRHDLTPPHSSQEGNP